VPSGRAPGPRPGYGDTGFDPLTAPAEALGLPPRRPRRPSRPRRPPPVARGGPAVGELAVHACGHSNAITAGVCGACGSAFLSGVRTSEGPLLALPVVGDLTKLQRSQRLGLAFVVMLVLVVLAALLMLLLS
jgi:hypothetical protein